MRSRARSSRWPNSGMLDAPFRVPGLVGGKGFGQLSWQQLTFVVLSQSASDLSRQVCQAHVVPACEDAFGEAPAAILARILIGVAKCGEHELATEVHLSVGADPTGRRIWTVESDAVRVWIVERHSVRRKAR